MYIHTEYTFKFFIDWFEREKEKREREREERWFVPLIYAVIGWFLYTLWPRIEPATTAICMMLEANQLLSARIYIFKGYICKVYIHIYIMCILYIKYVIYFMYITHMIYIYVYTNFFEIYMHNMFIKYILAIYTHT